eukprot:COSAG01_NODE_160_length_23692_cov_9.703599_31_plen_32_part_00
MEVDQDHDPATPCAALKSQIYYADSTASIRG